MERQELFTQVLEAGLPTRSKELTPPTKYQALQSNIFSSSTNLSQSADEGASCTPLFSDALKRPSLLSFKLAVLQLLLPAASHLLGSSPQPRVRYSLPASGAQGEMTPLLLR